MEGRGGRGILSFRGGAPAESSHRDILLNRVKIHYVSLSHEERPLCRHCCWVPFILFIPCPFPISSTNWLIGFFVRGPFWMDALVGGHSLLIRTGEGVREKKNPLCA